MDKVIQYRNVIQEVLDEYGQHRPSYGQVEVEKISDTVNDHYQLVTVGWNGNERIHGTLFHMDIIDGKIWITLYGKEGGMANK